MSEAYKCDKCKEFFDGSASSIDAIELEDFKATIYIRTKGDMVFSEASICESCKIELTTEIKEKIGGL